MKRKEAIQVLTHTLAYDSDFAEAKRMAIEALSSADIEEDVARRIATIIENEQDMRVILKNADRPTGWIPVSERLPENNGRYLVTRRERYIRILSGLGGADISAEACKELVELLKEQPEDKCGECDAWNQYKNYPRQRWIPCSERLPENNGCMLVTIDDAIEFGKYEDGEWSIWVCEHWDEWDAKGVTAWMPLPDSYKGGDSE